MNRFGYKWNINECLRLQREFELLCLPIDEIASRHKRTPKAIMFKLDEEGFATYTDLYNSYHGLNKFEVKYHLNNTHPKIQLSDYDETASVSIAESESESDEDQEAETDVGSYYNMRSYIKQLESQVANLLDYISQHISHSTVIESKRFGLPNEYQAASTIY